MVTTSYFTPDAVSTAEGYNIDLWDGVKLKEVSGEVPIEKIEVPSNVFYVEPKISNAKAKEKVDRELRGLFGRKGEIKSSSVVFYPYYEADIDARIYEEKGLIWRKVEEKIVGATVLIDAITEELCNFEPDNGIVRLLRSPKLSDEEARVFRFLSLRRLTTPALASLLSCSTSKAGKLIQGLVAKGIVERYTKGRLVFYQPKVKIPHPSSLKAISPNLKINTPEKELKVSFSPSLSLENVENLVELLWEGTVNTYKTIFCPYYVCKVVEEEKKYVKATDMMTNKLDERMSSIFTTSYSQLPF